MKQSNSPLVSVLILTFNRNDLLKSCLDSILKSDYPNLEILVADNHSGIDVKKFVDKQYPNKNIKVYRSKFNGGLTGGFNFGYKFCKGKYSLLLCNDTKIKKDAIPLMVKMAEKDPKIGMVAPMVIQMRYPEFIHSAGSFLTSVGLLYHYGVYQKKKYQKYHRNYYIFSSTGAGFLVRGETIKKSGLYNQDFFMAYDESDLCHRVWLSGYQIVYCHKAVLEHLWSATMDSSRSILWFWNQRNIISSFIINFSFLNMIMFLFVVNISFIFWSLVNLYRGKYATSLTLYQAYWWHINNIKKTLKQREYVQKKVRVISDKEMFEKTLVNPGWRYFLIHFKKRFNDINLPKHVIYTDRISQR